MAVGIISLLLQGW